MLREVENFVFLEIGWTSKASKKTIKACVAKQPSIKSFFAFSFIYRHTGVFHPLGFPKE